MVITTRLGGLLLALLLAASAGTMGACSSGSGGGGGGDDDDMGDGDSDADTDADSDADADADADGDICEDTCGDGGEWVGDGACDDGGPNSDFSVCEFGTDCTDCGPRNAADCDCSGKVCGDDGCGHECGAGCGENQYCNETGTACEPCSCGGAVCGWDQCFNSCGDCDAAQYCDDNGACQACDCTGRTCGYTEDGCDCGECTEPQACDNISYQCVTPSGTCDNTCLFAADGECDDGGANCVTKACAFGSDCEDCGARTANDQPLPDGTDCPN